MHDAALQFVKAILAMFPPRRSIVDVGSYNLNGQLRDLFPNVPYLGIDTRPGPNVDVVTDVLEWTPSDTMDCICCTETMEHYPAPQKIIAKCRSLLPDEGGLLIITAAGPGRYPHSGIDGKPRVRHMEHYEGIQPDRLRQWLTLWFGEQFHLETGPGEPSAGHGDEADVYAYAWTGSRASVAPVAAVVETPRQPELPPEPAVAPSPIEQILAIPDDDPEPYPLSDQTPESFETDRLLDEANGSW